jgi:hypothetical protein
MSLIASIRDDTTNLALLVHVFGAMVLVGGLVTGAAMLLRARGEAEVRLVRLGYWTLLAVALPGYVVMRIGAEWLYSREHLGQSPSDPTWIGIGYITADGGALVLLIALIAGGMGVRRLRQGKGYGALRASGVLAAILVAAYIVTIWAMGGKPD